MLFLIWIKDFWNFKDLKDYSRNEKVLKRSSDGFNRIYG